MEEECSNELGYTELNQSMFLTVDSQPAVIQNEQLKDETFAELKACLMLGIYKLYVRILKR